jgi:LysR family transcriptional regulator, low CO2-responsive transcriptional regulator
VVNLRHLEVFRTVVECESFSGAAEKLYMTQPAVSLQVQVVERHFRASLLERRNRRMVLTEAGQAVYRWAVDVLHSEAKTHELIDELKHAESGQVVVGASMTVGSYILPPILTHFKQLHPGAEFDVKVADRDELCTGVLSGRIDCAVLIAREIPSGLQTEVLGHDEMVFICAPSHRLANRKRVCAADLAKEPFIIAPKNSSYRRIIDDILARQGLDHVSVFMELDAAEGVKRGVQQGLGIGLALRSGVGWEIEHGLLCEIPAPGPSPQVELGLISRPRQNVSPMLKSFMDYLRDELPKQLERTKGVSEAHAGPPHRRALAKVGARAARSA